MLIKGEWYLHDDGILRPIVRIHVLDLNNHLIPENFLVDTGADRTVFREALVTKLKMPPKKVTSEFSLSGIGGASNFVLVTTGLEFARDGGGTARVRGEFAGFTDPAATDLSILGRDVLNHFDLIVSYTKNEILLLSQRHHYLVGVT